MIDEEILNWSNLLDGNLRTATVALDSANEFARLIRERLLAPPTAQRSRSTAQVESVGPIIEHLPQLEAPASPFKQPAKRNRDRGNEGRTKDLLKQYLDSLDAGQSFTVEEAVTWINKNLRGNVTGRGLSGALRWQKPKLKYDARTKLYTKGGRPKAVNKPVKTGKSAPRKRVGTTTGELSTSSIVREYMKTDHGQQGQFRMPDVLAWAKEQGYKTDGEKLSVMLPYLADKTGELTRVDKGLYQVSGKEAA